VQVFGAAANVQAPWRLRCRVIVPNTGIAAMPDVVVTTDATVQCPPPSNILQANLLV
jgi:hypothetical protein